MRFEVLGPLRLVRDGELIPLTSGRQRALLANLLLANETTLAADQLIEAVWGDELPSDPANTLQHGIAQLRKVLEPGRGRSDPPQTLLSDGAGYRLDLTDHQSDVAEFEELVELGHGLFTQGSYAAAADAARSALGLWRGRAYADFAYTNFAMAEADRLDELKIQARELLLDAETAHNGPEAVVADLEALASEHPYREGIWARLMTALYQSGRQAEALRAYHQAREALGNELGIEPSAELRDLEQQILLQDPLLARPRRGPIHNNIPAQSTRLVGREALLAQVVDFVRSVRLTTLLGPGGSGKTRLALEVANGVLDEFQDGTWLVRLDDLSDPDLVVATVGTVVGMPENRDMAVVDTLADFLAERRVLLLFDNCEHLVDAVATLAETLLTRCPDLTLLATSQVALKVNGEQRVPIPPLRLPGQDASPFDEIEAAPSVELFLERADAIDPSWDRSPDSIAAVANIVQALDGIPLAIELAAARIDLLTPVDIARRLADRFEVLDVGPRDAPERQRTLRKTVEWSYGLLDEEERAFFVHLGVFSGAFDAEAAAAVVGITESEALPIISRLLQRSLLTRDPSAPQLSRYRLLETLRLFGVDQLAAAGEIDAVKDLHLDHYAAVVRRMDEGLAGAQQLAVFAATVSEEDNFRAAMAWSLQSGRLAPGVTIAAWLGRFWDWRGSLAEASTWSNRFLEAQPDERTADLALLTSWAGFYARELGDESRSDDLAADSLRIAISQGDLVGHAVALTGVAMQARLRGEYADSIDTARQIRAIAAETGNPWLIAWADNHDGLSLLAAGDVVAAERVSAASLRGFEELGDRRATGWALTALAQVAHEQGHHTRTIELANSAVAVSCEAGDGRNAAWALELAGEAALSSGNEEAARRYAADAANLLQERGMPSSPWHRTA